MLSHCGRSAQLVAQLLPCLLYRQVQLLGRAGHAEHPGLVPEVAFELTEDADGCVGGEGRVVAGVKTPRSLYQRQECDLLQLVDWLATMPEAMGEGPGQANVVCHQVLLHLTAGQTVPAVGARPGLGRATRTAILAEQPSVAGQRVAGARGRRPGAPRTARAHPASAGPGPP